MARTEAGEEGKEMASGIFSGAQSGRRVPRAAIFFIWTCHNPLRSPNSAKGMQGNQRNFPWFFLHFLARNSPDSCICDASSLVSSGLPFGSPLSAGSVDNALGARRRDPERGPQAEIKRRPNKKPPELSLQGCQFQLIGMRSEVTGDAETSSKAVADALPAARLEGRTAHAAKVVDSADEPARR